MRTLLILISLCFSSLAVADGGVDAALALYDQMQSCEFNLTLSDQQAPQVRDVAEVRAFFESRPHARFIAIPARAPHGMFIGMFPRRDAEFGPEIHFELIKVMNLQRLTYYDTQMLRSYFDMMLTKVVAPTGSFDLADGVHQIWSTDWYDAQDYITPAVAKTRLVLRVHKVSREIFETSVRYMLEWDQSVRERMFP